MTRKSRPQLTESWDSIDYDDDSGDSSANVQEQDQGHESPLSYDDPDNNVRYPLRRSSRNTTPLRSIQESTAETSRRGSSISAEPSFVMPSIHEPQRTPYFTPLPEDPPTPRTRSSKRRVSSDNSRQASSPSSAKDTPRQSKVLREQPRRPRPQQRQKQEMRAEDESREPQLFEGIFKVFLWPVSKFLWRIFAGTLEFAMPWIPIIIGVWAIIGLAYFTANFAFFTASHALSPLCNVPFIAWYWSDYCGPRLSPPSAPQEFEELVGIQAAFEDVLSSSSSNAINSLPMDITRSVLHLGELRHNVRVSQLPSKNELVLELEAFDESANDASSKLGSFGSSIGRAVDKIITTNRWTLRKLDSITNADAERGVLERLKDGILSPFYPRVARYDEIIDQYLKHTDIVEEQITDLILEAQALVKALQLLDNQLDTIAFITKRDGVDINDAKDDLFARLWTYLGGNRYEAKQLDRKLALITDLSRYRQLAVAHVLATIRKLEGIQGGLKDLRLRIAEPRLDVGKRDMPLEWHIYNIQLGLERLEQQKAESKRALDEDLGRFYDSKGGRWDQSRMIEGKTVRLGAGAMK
ncbi:MAG: hypothetical protein M1821_007386 [Bathelium mastoideum]|nr:MAG: hypothetical protein M1821_007386 [Bathelium mastoideum]